jgi:hypothetical protein
VGPNEIEAAHEHLRGFPGVSVYYPVFAICVAARHCPYSPVANPIQAVKRAGNISFRKDVAVECSVSADLNKILFHSIGLVARHFWQPLIQNVNHSSSIGRHHSQSFRNSIACELPRTVTCPNPNLIVLDPHFLVAALQREKDNSQPTDEH